MFKATRKKLGASTPRWVGGRVEVGVVVVGSRRGLRDERGRRWLTVRQQEVDSSPHLLCPVLIFVEHLLSSRLVYRWFLFVYQITYALGIVGYLILLLLFTGLGLLLPFSPDSVMEFSVVLIFYGVYFGVMGRDFAVLCVDYVAASMTVSLPTRWDGTRGFDLTCEKSCNRELVYLRLQYTTSGKSLPKVELRSDMCAVCGQRIVLPADDDSEPSERTYRLECKHL